MSDWYLSCLDSTNSGYYSVRIDGWLAKESLFSDKKSIYYRRVLPDVKLLTESSRLLYYVFDTVHSLHTQNNSTGKLRTSHLLKKKKKCSGRLLCIWATFCFWFFCTDLIAITKGAFVRMRRIEIIVSNLRYRWLLSQVQYSLYYKCYRYHLAYWRLRHFRLGVSFYPSAIRISYLICYWW